MPEVTTTLIREVRTITGSGMQDVKRALQEADGDAARAVEALRLQGAKDVGRRAARRTSSGLVLEQTENDRTVLVELLCETDFVAKTPLLGELASRIAEHVHSCRLTEIGELLDSECDGATVRSLLQSASSTLGERLELHRVVVSDAPYRYVYLHRTSTDLPPTIAGLVEVSAAFEAGTLLAQQVVASRPAYLSEVDVPGEILEQERRVAEMLAREEGRPEAVVPRIVEGRMRAFCKEVVLLEQPFLRSPDRTVKSLLEADGVELLRFERLQVGS